MRDTRPRPFRLFAFCRWLHIMQVSLFGSQVVVLRGALGDMAIAEDFQDCDLWPHFVKLNDPVMTVWPSITITLLWAIACSASI